MACRNCCHIRAKKAAFFTLFYQSKTVSSQLLFLPICRQGRIWSFDLRELGVQIPWIGSPTTAAATSLKLAGPALYGSYAAVDFNRDSSMAAKEFAAKYEAAYTSAPDVFASWAYDAVHVLALAINNAQSLDAQKIREAILSVKGYPGAEGT